VTDEVHDLLRQWGWLLKHYPLPEIGDVTGLTKGQLPWLRKHKINPHAFADVAKAFRASGVVIPDDEMGEDSA
jgi:hypothetical protein